MVSSPVSPSRSSTRAGPLNWVLLVLGVLLTALGLGLSAGGVALMGAEAAQRDEQYLTGPEERLQSTGFAVTTESMVIDPGEAGITGLPPLSELASIRIRVTPVVPDEPVFVGVAEVSDVSGYLADVPHSTAGDTDWMNDAARSPQWDWDSGADPQLRDVPGTRNPAPPAEQDFWAVSATGTGTQEITFDLQEGQWNLVVMNADADRPVWVDLEAGVRTDLLGAVNPGLLIAGLVGLLLGIPLLLFGAAGLGRDIAPRDPALAGGTGLREPGHSPLTFTGRLDEGVSRGLWLVKWLLAIPHYLVLGLLWFALVVTTIAAGLAILFTGRFPRSWFNYSVGVLRWNWRVGFYAYSALGTDRYPPFTLAAGDYPADLDVAYPEQLSRGLVLVKWWLLAIPHFLVVSVIAGSGGTLRFESGDGNGAGMNLSLLGLLVLVVAVILLFTGRYRRDTFDLIVGLNRWVYRVFTYVLLLRDEYPPFRLDQGPVERTAAERTAAEA